MGPRQPVAVVSRGLLIFGADLAVGCRSPTPAAAAGRARIAHRERGHELGDGQSNRRGDGLDRDPEQAGDVVVAEAGQDGSERGEVPFG